MPDPAPSDDSTRHGADANDAPRVHDQTQSLFFSRLPIEVRRNIYYHLWLSTGSTQHIYKAGNSRFAELSHAACVTDPDARDPRDEEVARRCQDQTLDDPGDIDFAYEELTDEPGETTDDWVIRLFSDWCNHFRCEEAPEIPQVPPSEKLQRQLEESTEDDGKLVQTLPTRSSAFFFSPFLAPLLTCRQMSIEAQQSLYESVTFSFIGTGAMRRFLETTSPDLLAQVRRIHIIWRAPTEAYCYDGEDPDNPDNRNLVSALRDWSSLWQSAKNFLPRLKELRVWAYPVYARFPMPKPAWFQPLYAFGSLKLQVFTVKLLWDWEHGVDPDTVPSFLEDAPFDLTREPPMYYDAQNWRLLWERASTARNLLKRDARRRLAAVRQHRSGVPS